MQSRNKTIALIGIYTCIGIIFGYVEYLIPLPVGIPGIKIGLSNIVTVVSMCVFNWPVSAGILFLRVIMSGLLFGNIYSLLYSLSGALISFCVMTVCKNHTGLSLLGISALGGVFHNMAQLFVAALVIENIKMTYYLPVLIISGLIAGIIVGIISTMIYLRITGMKGEYRQ